MFRHCILWMLLWTDGEFRLLAKRGLVIYWYRVKLRCSSWDPGPNSESGMRVKDLDSTLLGFAVWQLAAPFCPSHVSDTKPGTSKPRKLREAGIVLSSHAHLC